MTERPKMPTIGGKSVRNEIEERLAAARIEGRNLGIEESIAFLRLSGLEAAAVALDEAAFGPTPAVPS